MKEQGYEQLTLFPGDSLASPSPSPGNEQARKMTVSSGQKCSELLRNCGPLGYLAKTCLESSIWHSTRCLLTWKTQATKANALLFRLVASTHRTKGNASLLWPTPSTGAALCGGTGNLKTLRKMAEKGLITEDERKNLSQGNGGKTNPGLLEWLMGYEQKFTELIPTPTTSQIGGAPNYRFYGGGGYYRDQLHELTECTPLGKIGRLNPEWTEWLMGYPIGWTALNV